MTIREQELRSFQEQNPGFDLLQTDFHDRAAMSVLDWGALDSDAMLAHLKAKQRVLRLVDSEESATRLVAAGLDSAHRIAASSETRFVREHGDVFIDESEAREVHRRAAGIRSKTQHVWANVRDLVVSRHYRQTLFYNAREDVATYFEEIPSYQDLFGGLDYLGCPHCRSILGPTAYFVDLMRITDEYVTYPNTHKGEGNIPAGMKLEERRPDLFTMPLTCASADTVVRYLEIVNDALEQKLKLELGTDVFPALSVAAYPFDLPFNLPLEQVRENVVELGSTLAGAYTAFLGPIAAGTPQAGGTASVRLAEDASARNGYYVGMEVAVTAGPGSGQVRRIAAYDGATRTADVALAWTAQPGTESRYEVTDALDVAREQVGLSPDQYQMEITPQTGEAAVAAAWGYSNMAGVLTPFVAGPGRISFAVDGLEVTGDRDAHFDTELSVGDQLWCGAEIRSVAAIAGPTKLTVDARWRSAAQAASYRVARWAKGAGTITIHRDSTRVTGDANARLDLRSVGDQLQCSGAVRTIVEVRSAAEVLVDARWPVDATNAAYTVNPVGQLARMTTFLARTGLDRPQLDALLRQDTSQLEFDAGATDGFFINATGEELPPLQLVTDLGDPSNPFERIVGLSLRRLDRLSRFIRLQRQAAWTAADLDWLMVSIGSTEIDGRVVEAIAVTQRLSADDGPPVDVVTSLWHDMKTVGRVDDARPQDLFDRVYNAPALLRGQDPYTSAQPIPFDPARPLTWDIDERTAGSAGATIRSRLVGALGLSDDDLTRVAHFTRALQGRTGTSLSLDLATLSWLYRLTKQAAWSALTVDAYLTLLWMLFYPAQALPLPPPQGAVPVDIASAVRVDAAAAWLRESPFTVYELQYVVTGEQTAYYKQGFTVKDLRTLVDGLAVTTEDLRLGPASFVFENVRAEEAEGVFDAVVALGLVTPLGIATDLQPTYVQLSSLYPLTKLSFITGDIDAVESARVFDELAAHVPPLLIVAPGAETGTLSEAFTPETSLAFLFPGDPQSAQKQAEVREVLLQTRRQIDNVDFVLGAATAAQEGQAEQAVADFVALDLTSLLALLAFCTGQQSLAAQRVALLAPLSAEAEVPPAVVALMTTLSRGALWVGTLGFTAPELASIAANPGPFGIADTKVLGLSDIRALERFRRLTVALGDQNGILLDYFRAPLAAGIVLLSELTGWSVAQITLLVEVFWPARGGSEAKRTTVDGVQRLKAAFDFCELTGTDAFLMVGLMDLSHLSAGVVGGAPDLVAWAAYEAGASRTLDALSGRYGEDFSEVHATVAGRVDTAKRDALVGYTIVRLQPDFPFLRSAADLYQFLLIDVEMSDCATTSLVAQGISSVQLYLQRCRMNLEPGVTRLDVDPVWWEWLTAYRVWEANRKIFLYPENYVEPQLRSGQSPEFKRLAEALRQTDLNQSAVDDAFLAYFDELDGLASLVPIASHNADIGRTDDDQARDRLFVIARPRTDPYTYFWRTHDPVESWSPWQKVDLSISSPEISAVYAFGRLFLFWAELETGKTSTIANATADPRYVRNAVLRYSFLTVSGEWVQPQLLVADYPTEVEPNAYQMLKLPAVKEALTSSGLFWRQPYPLNVARGLPGTGRVRVTSDLSNVDGTNTHFLREVRIGDRISVGGQTRVVGIVVDDTSLAVVRPWTRTAQSAEFKVIPERADDNAFPSFAGAGSVSITAGLGLVTGDAQTRFKQEVSVGDRILCANEVRTVELITADNNLLVHDAWTVTASDESYVVIPQASGAEQLVVMYGGALSTAAGVDPVAPAVSSNAGRDNFLQQLDRSNFDIFYSATLAKDATLATPPVPGQVTLNYAAVLDADLQVLSTRALLADYTYSASDNPRPYQYRVDRSERLLRAAQSDNAVADNCWGNNAPGTPPPAKSTGLSRNLLYNVSSANASLRNVSNQSGWSIFDNGDEAFLVRSSEVGLQQLSDMIIGRRTSDAQLGEAMLLSAGAFTGAPSGFDELDFEFVRMTTSVVPRLRQRLFAGGIARLLTLESQMLPELPFNRFYATPTGGPPPRVIPPPADLDFEGAYGLYFQEIFLFGPWLIADRLRGEHRFAEAKAWYEYVFNPTEQGSILDEHPSDRYWRYLPFRDLTIASLVADLTDPKQVAAYNDHPFDPDAIARLRPAAYPKALVLDYIDNLIAWGDFLFALDTSESINEATQLYVLADDLLGERPQEVGVCPIPKTQSFNDIRARYGQDIPQFLIDLENGLPDVMNAQGVAFGDVPINDVNAYFCVPENSELTGYWDRVEDRLFKIRHCMNLQGVVRQLPLFEPPLDPHQLVRAHASSRDGTPTRGAVTAPLPLYRFTVMLDKAKAFTASVTSFGAALLAALEKQDAEALALLRNSQEAAILDLTVQAKELQVQQVIETGKGLVAVRSAAETRQTYFTRMLTENLSPEELQNLDAMEAGLVFNLLATVARTASSIAYTIPQVGSPFAMTYGGVQVGSALSAAATVFEVGSIISQFKAQKSLTMASYQRRREEWQLQLSLSELDETGVAAQIAANDIQRQIAERDLQITRTSVTQNRDMQAFLLKQFTNEQLYQWMAGKLSEVYFQSWLLALALAREAERVFQYELNTSQRFLDFVYWDSPRKGLLAGEGLALALCQMEKAYIDGNVRGLEIEKTVSLAQINPRALLDLKRTGQCVFDLSERLFDFDYPGHYCRKLKTVSVTIPAVTGPYQPIHATLTQLTNSVVLKPDVEAIKFLLGSSTTVPAPDVLRSNVWVNQQIALSRGINDTGLFQLDFNDPRFLPFEGTGAVSAWRLSMPTQTNRFDFSSVSDVLVQLSYTAIDGGDGLRRKVVSQPQLKDYVGSPLLSLAQLYSQAWFAFMSDHSDPASQTLRFEVPPDIVPPHLEQPRLVGFFFVLVTRGPDGSAQVQALEQTPYITFSLTADVAVTFAPNPKGTYSHTFDQPLDMADVLEGDRTIRFALTDAPPPLKAGGFLDPEIVENIAVILYYQATINWQRPL